MNIFSDMFFTKQFAAIYFFLIFLIIVFRTLKKSSKERLEQHKHIPFSDD